MERISLWLIVVAFTVASLAPLSAQAKDVKMTHAVGAYSVELGLLKAEPFAASGGSGMMSMGGGQPGMMMVVEGGVRPVPVDDPSHPNHHLVVHVHDAASGKALARASVAISFTPVDASGTATGPATKVPVVVMEASGMGAASTHYGNNVTMPPGAYRIDVTVNGVKTVFRVNA